MAVSHLHNCLLFVPIIMAGNVLIQDMFRVYILLYNVFKLHITKYLLYWHGNSGYVSLSVSFTVMHVVPNESPPFYILFYVSVLTKRYITFNLLQ